MNSQFEELPPLSIECKDSTLKGVTGHRIVCDADGDGVYLVGGWNPSHIAPESESDMDKHYVREVWKFNIAKRIWTQLRSDNPPRSLASHCLVNLGRTTSDGHSHLLVFGGSLSYRGVNGNSNETHLYDAQDERWEQLVTSGTKPPEKNSHWFGQAMARRDNFVFVAAGWGNDDYENPIDRVDVHRLDLRSLVWEWLSSEASGGPQCRVRHDIVVDEDEKIYVIGGANDFVGQCYDLIDIPYFDSRSRQWRNFHTLPDSVHGYPFGRSCCGSVLYAGYVYFVGGRKYDIHEDGTSTVPVCDDCWRLHLTTGQWSKLSICLPRPLWFHSVDVDVDGVLYVFGGCAGEDYYQSERPTQLWRVRLTMQPLKRLAWDTILKYSTQALAAGKLSDKELLEKLPLPASFILPKINW